MSGRRRPIRVLLVDDEVEFLDSTARALSRRGCDVHRAEHGQVALRQLRERPFDVVVLDVNMPGLDGVAVHREIRLRWPRLPVIMLTGHGSVAQAFTSSKEGVFAYLTKPCDIERLADAVRDAAASVSRRPPGRGQPTLGVPLRLLIVDDEEDFLVSMKRVLVRRGVEVTTASSGAEGLALLQERAFAVVLADVKMPGMNGIELLREVKRCQPLTEVIFLTGHPSVDVAVAGVKGGAFDYLVKPTDIDDLLDKLADAFVHHLAQADRRRTELVDSILDKLSD